MRISGTVATEDRRRQLSEILRSTGSIALVETARQLGVHPMTIRRDLDYFEREGIARRVRGGAVFVGPADFQQRQGRELSAKRRIASKLQPLIPEHGAIGMDASTTIYQLARTVPQVRDLAVVTNGMATFEALQQRDGVRAFLTGGEAERTNASLVGALAVNAVSNFVFARCFMSTTSLDPDFGTSEPTTVEVDVKRAMARASKHVVLAVDSSKLGTQSVVRGLAFADIDLLVTELEPEDPRLDLFRESVELV